MVQGTDLTPILQEKGDKKNIYFCKRLNMNYIKTATGLMP
jgi:hypothetical protein